MSLNSENKSNILFGHFFNRNTYIMGSYKHLKLLNIFCYGKISVTNII